MPQVTKGSFVFVGGTIARDLLYPLYFSYLS